MAGQTAKSGVQEDSTVLADTEKQGTHDTDGASTLADAVIGLVRTVRRSKARALAATGDDVDSAARILLRTVSAEGPLRASALATAVQSDLSTVSRQVALLVARGLLERHADPDDGRASLLQVTPAAQAVIAESDQARTAFFDDVVRDWPPEERDRFVHLLEQFTEAYDTTHTRWMSDAAIRRGALAKKPREGSTT
ncbi:MarR family transcriptional regulator [Streptomyces sp. NPDC008150]|uniref:MarR family winged helix-turn-helix transcriptional regulator n=1 Tax=Streptomyces sp. NPDC008150 TaxID=3364816 RepID=UPI0036E20E31